MSSIYFDKVKNYLLDLNYGIEVEDDTSELFVIEKEEDGIKNVIVDCEDQIVIIESLIFEINTPSLALYEWLLKENRNIVHGAFVLDETGKKVLYRDTLQLENLDLNELEASLNSLQLLLSEYINELLEFSKN